VLDEAPGGFVAVERYFGGLVGWAYDDVRWSRAIDGNRLNAYRPAQADVQSTPTWQLARQRSALTYNKTALWMATLERSSAGTRCSASCPPITRACLQASRPGGVLRHCRETAGETHRFFDTMHRSEAVFDYGVAQACRPPEPADRRGPRPRWPAAPEQDRDRRAPARRRRLPVDVRTTFDDRTTDTIRWTAGALEVVHVWLNARVVRVDVNPDRAAPRRQLHEQQLDRFARRAARGAYVGAAVAHLARGSTAHICRPHLTAARAPECSARGWTAGGARSRPRPSRLACCSRRSSRRCRWRSSSAIGLRRTLARAPKPQKRRAGGTRAGQPSSAAGRRAPGRSHEIIGFGGTLSTLSRFVDARELDPAIVSAVAGYLLLDVPVGGILDRYSRQRPIRTAAFFAACGVYFMRFLRLAVLVAPFYWLLFRVVHPLLFETTTTGRATTSSAMPPRARRAYAVFLREAGSDRPCR
jgi:hypothetical protein